MKSTVVLLALLGFLAGTFPLQSYADGGKEEGVEFFHGSWEDLLAKAKKNKQPFWVDFWAPWCGPCKMLNKTTFKSTEVADYSKKYFIAYKVNVDEGIGKELGAKYSISSIPAIFFFDHNGKVINKVVGYQDATAFLNTLKKNTPNSAILRGSKKGKNTDFYTYDDYMTVKEEYFQTIETQIRDQQTDFSKYLDQSRQYGELHKEFEYEEMKRTAAASFSESNIWWMDIFYYLGAKKYDKIASAGYARFEAKQFTSVEEQHWLLWQCMALDDLSGEPVRWLNALIREQGTYELLDTKAAFYMKEKKYQLSEEVVKEALKVSKDQDKDNTPTHILDTLLKNL